MIYLRPCKKSLVEQVFLQLHPTISSSNSINCYLLLREIYEDIFIPKAIAEQLRECQGSISI